MQMVERYLRQRVENWYVGARACRGLLRHCGMAAGILAGRGPVQLSRALASRGIWNIRSTKTIWMPSSVR